MERVLVIDLSYIMASSISLYEDWISGDWSSEIQQWDIMHKKLGQFPPADMRRSDYLLRILYRALPNLHSKDQVLFLRSHNDILDKIGSSEHLILHNVDHHHGIDYTGQRLSNVISENNWIGRLDQTGCLSEYRWFGSKNSKKYKGHLPLACQYTQTTDRRRLPMSDPDLIVICESPFWVPPDERSLFSIMRQAVDSYFREVEYDENHQTTSQKNHSGRTPT